MKETDLYATLRPHLGECDRVENSAASGMGDVFYNLDYGVTGWIETKLIKNGLIYFERFQPQWLRKHSDLGARIWVIAMDLKGSIYMYRARDGILKAPRTLIGKWTTVKCEDFEPTFVMHKPYKQWDRVVELLTS